MTAAILKNKLRAKASPQAAKMCQSFFKTGPGEYGEGDIFIGVKMPDLRLLAKVHIELPLRELKILLKSPVHEERMLGLIIMTLQFGQAHKLDDQALMLKYYNFYMIHRKFINNWDLVDVTAANIVGAFLYTRDHSILAELAKSKKLWERRIAIVSTHYFIRQHDFSETLILAKTLLNDEQDLIHKAVGWMLRELGKKDEAILVKFLDLHGKQMPRTMLRYAIERLVPAKRKHYLLMK